MMAAALISPWEPDTDVANLRILGKCAEEKGEAVQMLARCIIQGIDECEPVTGKSNRQALEDELADNQATDDLLIEHFGLDLPRIRARAAEKKARLTAWFEMMQQSG